MRVPHRDSSSNLEVGRVFAAIREKQGVNATVHEEIDLLLQVAAGDLVPNNAARGPLRTALKAASMARLDQSQELFVRQKDGLEPLVPGGRARDILVDLSQSQIEFHSGRASPVVERIVLTVYIK
eukprot:CAMPEP_0198588200 /NCGR_PEP_ID=MMETSP1462-20131121/132816_1 /TAXON_ID=1333877 /ORGANISM="Brandtodinium nutriculum, Strain RCC3387" /LENGTH=124 /DNA_ID=CAMNT_0044319697 /DNA_START=801 /DNA_END=1175 /DNA_ORIENTATION=+